MIEELDRTKLGQLFENTLGPNILVEEMNPPDEDHDHDHFAEEITLGE